MIVVGYLCIQYFFIPPIYLIGISYSGLYTDLSPNNKKNLDEFIESTKKAIKSTDPKIVSVAINLVQFDANPNSVNVDIQISSQSSNLNSVLDYTDAFIFRLGMVYVQKQIYSSLNASQNDSMEMNRKVRTLNDLKHLLEETKDSGSVLVKSFSEQINLSKQNDDDQNVFGMFNYIALNDIESSKNYLKKMIMLYEKYSENYQIEIEKSRELINYIYTIMQKTNLNIEDSVQKMNAILPDYSGLLSLQKLSISTSEKKHSVINSVTSSTVTKYGLILVLGIFCCFFLIYIIEFTRYFIRRMKSEIEQRK